MNRREYHDLTTGARTLDRVLADRVVAARQDWTRLCWSRAPLGERRAAAAVHAAARAALRAHRASTTTPRRGDDR